MGGSSLYIWGQVDDPDVEHGAAASRQRAEQRRRDAQQTFTGDIGEPLPEEFKRYLESLPPLEAFQLLNARERAVAPMYAEPGAPLAARLQQPLVDDLMHFLHDRLTPAWPATARVLDGYLAQQPPTCYLRRSDLTAPSGRRRRADEPPTWYLQLHFTGNSGLLEVSAALAAHWTDHWFRENRDRLARELLAPIAFTAQAEQPTPRHTFVPIDRTGYARFLVREPEATAESPAGAPVATDSEATEFDTAQQAQTIPHLETGARFAVDRASLTRRDSVKFIASLDDRFGPLMADGQCRCQLCAPDFVPTDVTVEPVPADR